MQDLTLRARLAPRRSLKPARDVGQRTADSRRVADPNRRARKNTHRMCAVSPGGDPPAAIAAQCAVMGAGAAEVHRVPAWDRDDRHPPRLQLCASLVDGVPAQDLRKRRDLLPALAPVELVRAPYVPWRGALRTRGAVRPADAKRCAGNAQPRIVLEGRDDPLEQPRRQLQIAVELDDDVVRLGKLLD